MKIRKVCPICKSKEYRILHQSNFTTSDINPSVFSARRRPDRVHGTFVRCSVCGLVRSLEIISDSKLASLYRKSNFTYGNLVENLRSDYGRILDQALPYVSKRNYFLEIGCGNGFLLEKAKKRLFKHIYGVEPSLDAIKKAKPTVRKYIKSAIYTADLFKKNRFDLIVLFQVFDHISDPVTFLKHCKQNLNKDGVLLIMNHDVEALSAKVLGSASPIFDIEHTFLYSQTTIGNILANNGFKIKKVYSPTSTFSVDYILRLLPIPTFITHWIQILAKPIMGARISFRPGNLCVIAKKTTNE